LLGFLAAILFKTSGNRRPDKCCIQQDTRGINFESSSRIASSQEGVEVMTMPKKILAPIGEAERSEAIVPVLSALAQGAGSTVRLMRVFPVPDGVVDSDGRMVAFSHQEMARLTSEGLDDLGRIEARLAGIPVETVVRFGEPVEEILLEVEAFDADLIALAGSGGGRLRNTFAPDSAERLASKAPIPTLTLRQSKQ